MRKKLLALLLAAGLALSLLAGCGGGKALSQVIVDLLDNLYSNVSVEADSDLTAALKQAAAEGGTEEEILSRMIEILNHKGGSITFTRLGSGQQGDHAVTLYFQTGTDPDAAARNALAQWAGTLGTLPDDGSYQADVAMIETENGYYIALDVEVLKAGKPDKPDKDDDEPETQEPPEPDKGYTVDGNTYSVSNAHGLKAVAELVNNGETDIDITLTSNIDLTGEWTPIGTALNNSYTGTFNGDNHTITGLTVTTSDQYAGLFGYIGTGGKVMNVKLEGVQIESDNGISDVGGVAGYSRGTLENCSVSGSVSGSGMNGFAGGVVGYQSGGFLTGCSSSATVNAGNIAGGVAGCTDSGATLTACYATGDVTLESINSGGNFAGGVVGINTVSTLKACYAWGSVTGRGNGTIYVGGVTGTNDLGTLIACYHANGTVSGGTYNGGVTGRNYKFSNDPVITACYWGNNGQTQGIGENQADTGDTTQVTGDVTWQTAYQTMNAALKDAGSKWRYNGTTGTLIKQ